MTTINSNGIIPSGNEVSFKAGESITLIPGFHAQLGSDFIAKIETCATGIVLFEDESISKQSLILKNNESPLADIHLSVAPNPFHNQTILDFFLPKATKTIIALFDQTGRLVKTVLPLQQLEKGKHQIILSANELQGGLYYAILQTTEKQVVQKMVLMNN